MRMMDRYDTVMVLVDFQTKLAPKMQNAEETEATIIRMVRAARVLGIPIIVTTVSDIPRARYPRRSVNSKK